MSNVAFLAFFLVALPAAALAMAGAVAGTVYLAGTPYWPAILLTIPVSGALGMIVVMCGCGVFVTIRDIVRGHV